MILPGCILVGENKVKGKVINSTKYELELVRILEDAIRRGENNNQNHIVMVQIVEMTHKQKVKMYKKLKKRADRNAYSRQ